MEALRHALAHSIHEVFVLAAVAVTVAFLACFFLEEIPLRKVNRADPVPDGQRRDAPAGAR